MKYVTYVVLLLLACGLLFASIKNKQTEIITDTNYKQIELKSEDNGKIILANINDTIVVTLRNPGDGGYSFKEPQYNEDLIEKIGYKHLDATSANLVGDFGKDVWIYKVNKTGKTDLIYEIFRSGQENIPEKYFNVTINVE